MAHLLDWYRELSKLSFTIFFLFLFFSPSILTFFFSFYLPFSFLPIFSFLLILFFLSAPASLPYLVLPPPVVALPRTTTCANRRRLGTRCYLCFSPPGLTEPVGTGPETVGTGPTGPDRFRFRPVPNWSKFKFWIWIQKMKKSHKILKKYFKVCRI
jgi:hypothetical protein